MRDYLIQFFKSLSWFLLGYSYSLGIAIFLRLLSTTVFATNISLNVFANMIIWCLLQMLAFPIILFYILLNNLGLELDLKNLVLFISNLQYSIDNLVIIMAIFVAISLSIDSLLNKVFK